jgi:hypothetical protein
MSIDTSFLVKNSLPLFFVQSSLSIPFLFSSLTEERAASRRIHAWG